MRILLTGFVVFVIWSFFSVWLYVDIILPSMEEPVTVQTIPEPKNNEADSLAKLYGSMPKDLMIYFEFNSSEFKTDPQAENSIAEFTKWLEKYPASKITVTGHTDLVGTTDFNQSLGQKRGMVAQKFLIKNGISSERIEVSSKGESKPLGDYLTSEERAKNRRAEISIKK